MAPPRKCMGNRRGSCACVLNPQPSVLRVDPDRLEPAWLCAPLIFAWYPAITHPYPCPHYPVQASWTWL